MADPVQGETGGKSLTSKLKAKVPHTRVKDTVKSLKSRLPGMKKHGGGDEEGHEDSSEYDDGSPRSPGPETGHNFGESTAPFSGVNTTSASKDFNPNGVGSPREVHNRDSDWRPSQISSYGYDSQNRNYVAAAPPTRPAPMATGSPRSNLAPSLEEKFKHLDVGEKSPRAVDPATDRGYQPERDNFPSTTTTESMQKGYNDVPRDSSYRASPTTPTNKGMVEKVRDSVTGAAVALGDKMGYYNDQPNAAPRDPNAPSILDKAKSTLGLNNPNAPPVTEQAKAYMNVAGQKTREYGATAADHAAWTKDRVAAHTTPTHHDKALSEQVTQTLSTLPGTIREKVFGSSSPSANSPNTPPGIVDRVSGAVSSLLSPSPKERQDTFPAHPDYHGSVPAPNTSDRS